jgi:SAM-dependent methyltransferase
VLKRAECDISHHTYCGQHAASEDYKVKNFLENPSYISDVVDFDKPLLGSIDGLNCVHLQCHIGTDTLSLSRLGAASVTGLDFSSESLAQARKLASAAGGEKLKFVEASVYEGLGVLSPGTFDLVYTGIGALCWIPSVREWAKVVAGLLKPGGRLFIREGHPILWALDDKSPDKLTIELPYFEREEPMMFHDEDTYVETGGHKFKAAASAEFNHGLGEIVEALLSQRMRITGLVEHQSVPWLALPAQMEPDHRGERTLCEL